jgi:hypothetical protein
MSALLTIWYIVLIVQAILGVGTAYRATRKGGDNGVALFGWLFVFNSLVPLIPGLGFYFWNKSKEWGKEKYEDF